MSFEQLLRAGECQALEFKISFETGRLLEADLGRMFINKLHRFLLKLGKGFAFVTRQMRISADTQNSYTDLVFYHYLLKCFVPFNLKVGELTYLDIGQLDVYVRMADDLQCGSADIPSKGFILCAAKNASVMQRGAGEYKLVLPFEDEFRAELEREWLWLAEQKEVRGRDVF